MSVKLKVSKNLSSILFFDSQTLPEIVDINSQFFSLKVYFSIALNNLSKNPIRYSKVKLTVSTQSKIFQSANKKEYSNYLENSTIKKNTVGKNYQKNFNTPKLSKNSNFNKAQVSSTISSAAQAKYDLAASSINSFINKQGENNSESSKTILVNEKIINALSTPVHFTGLVLPEFVSTYQEKRLSNSGGVVSQNFKESLVKENTSISQIISGYLRGIHSEYSHFSNQFIDYLIQGDTTKFSLGLDYYIKQRTLKYLDALTISEVINLPIRLLKEGKLLIKLSLFSIDAPNTEDETLNLTADLANCLEAYYATIKNIDSVISKAKIDNKVKTVSVCPFFNDSHSDKKVNRFNLYIKQFSSSNINEKFNFVKSLEKNEIYTEFFDDNTDYQTCYRVKPVTDIGELNIFSDLLFTSLAGNTSKSKNSVLLYARQTSTNSIMLDVKLNPIEKINKFRVYRRDCTNSPNADYSIIVDYNTSDISDSVTLSDNNIYPGHTYEYFVDILDDNNLIVDLSLSQIVEVKYVKAGSYSVQLSNVSSGNDKIQFSITSTSLKNDSKTDFLKLEEEKIKVVAANQQSPLEVKDLKDTIYHIVSRIDTISRRKEVFGIVTDGTFVDDLQNQIRSNVSPLVKGRTYSYEVESYKRNPVNLIDNFLVVGDDFKGQKWFYKPSKWSSPSVMNSGILSADEENSSMKDLFMSDFIGVSIAKDVEYDVEPTQDQIQNLAVERLTRSIIKISWTGNMDYFDSFVVVKVVNGKKDILGISSSFSIYHQVDFESDIGTIYYEIIPIKNNYSFGQTLTTNSFLVAPDLVDKF